MTKRKAPAIVTDTSDRSWHLDRKVPIAMIITLVLFFTGQTLTATWWASKTDSRIEVLEKDRATAAPTATDQGNRLTRVEVKLETALEGIAEIKAILRREPTPDRR